MTPAMRFRCAPNVRPFGHSPRCPPAPEIHSPVLVMSHLLSIDPSTSLGGSSRSDRYRNVVVTGGGWGSDPCRLNTVVCPGSAESGCRIAGPGGQLFVLDLCGRAHAQAAVPAGTASDRFLGRVRPPSGHPRLSRSASSRSERLHVACPGCADSARRLRSRRGPSRSQDRRVSRSAPTPGRRATATATISTGSGCRGALSVDEAGEPGRGRPHGGDHGAEVAGRHAASASPQRHPADDLTLELG